MYTDDPLRDFRDYSDAQEERMKMFPVCEGCGHTIQLGDYRWHIPTVGDLCDDCAKSEFREELEDEY